MGKMTVRPTPKAIERSRPHYGRRVFLAAAVFASLLGVNLYTFAHLVFRDLGDRMRKEVIAGAQQRALELARRLAEQGQIDLYRVHKRETVISSYVNEVLTSERY